MSSVTDLVRARADGIKPLPRAPSRPPPSESLLRQQRHGPKLRPLRGPHFPSWQFSREGALTARLSRLPEPRP